MYLPEAVLVVIAEASALTTSSTSTMPVAPASPPESEKRQEWQKCVQ
jgi:hypothetical protein